MSAAKTPYLYFEPDKAGRLVRLGLMARRAVEGFITGLHRSPHKGFSVEFAEHREYVPGDDVRTMDWVAWARSDRYYVKQFEQQTNLRAHILLDVSASMDYRHAAGQTKFQYGCFLAACLAYLLARQQDMVALVAFDRSVRLRLAPGSTPAHLDRVFTSLEKIQPGGATAVAETFHTLAETIAKRGLVIILSDLYDEPEGILKALQHFVYRKHQVILLHLMDPAELEFPFTQITQFVDQETGQRLQVDPRTVRSAYQEEVRSFIEGYRRECGDRNIEYLLTPTDTPYERMLLQFLAWRKAARR
ncbi:MAG: DUF58 domain-containing protein [Planctomycetota bacterium]|nr:DUF58 domain-containing protein [Planctomycetota bacterium]